VHSLPSAGVAHANGDRATRLVSLVAAIVAVLAAIGTLFAHHRSISALTEKNQAILLQAKASDTYGRSDAKRVRSEIIGALIDGGVYRNAAARQRLEQYAATEKQEAEGLFAKAHAFEVDSEAAETRSEKILQSYENLQIATTFFEISIVLVSISTLVRTRTFLTAGSGLTLVGLVLLVLGLFQGR